MAGRCALMLAVAVLALADLPALTMIGVDDNAVFSAALAVTAALLAGVTAVLDFSAESKADCNVGLHVDVDGAGNLSGVEAAWLGSLSHIVADNDAWVLDLVATQTSLLVSAGKDDFGVLHHHFAEVVALLTTGLGAGMLAVLSRLQAWLLALVNSMKHLGMALRTAGVATVERLVAEEVAPSFR